MGSDQRDAERTLRLIGILVPCLLAVRFSSGVMLVAMALTASTLSSLSIALEVYGIGLTLVLLGSIAVLLRHWATPKPRWISYSPLLILITAFVVWLASSNSMAPPWFRAAFPIFASVSVAAISAVCPSILPNPDRLWKHPQGWAYILLLVLVPVVFGMRVAVGLGLGTSPGPGGSLQGSWLLVNAPTVALELFAIGVWLYLVSDPSSRGARRRWEVWVPFVLLVPVILALFSSSLFAFVFSAFITWGTNLAVFLPVASSLSLAAASVACYASCFLLARRRGYPPTFSLLFGTLSVILAGFYPSIVGVAGLSYGLLVTTGAVFAGSREAGG